MGLAVGALGGSGSDRGGRLWLGGLLLEAGPLEGVQIRLGASLVRSPDGMLLRLETWALWNFRLGAWVYGGGGIGVDRLTISEGAAIPMRFPLLAAAGLKTRPDPRIPWRFFVEGRAWVLLPLLSVSPRGLGTLLAAGVLLSF